MKKTLLLLIVSLVLGVRGHAQTNTAILQWMVYGKQIYCIDIKTNLTDAWYPYAIVAMCGHYLGMDAQGQPVYSLVTADMHQPVNIEIPVDLSQGYFRLYTAPDNTNGIVGPTANSHPVPFKLIPPRTSTNQVTNTIS